MYDFGYNPAPKATKSVRIKPTQRQMGDISAKVDKQLKERSNGVCELCGLKRATERAHLTGRKQLTHNTRVTDLIHLCTECHDWLDETSEGIRARKFIATAINKVLQVK